MGNKNEWIVLQSASTKSRPMSSRDTTSVMKLDGGWLIKFRHFDGSSSPLTTQDMTFIPDPHHKWNPELENPKWETLSKKAATNTGEYIRRLNVGGGFVYQNCFFTKVAMHISLQYVVKPQN